MSLLESRENGIETAMIELIILEESSMNRSAHIFARPALALAIVLSLVAGAAEAQTKVSPGWNMFSTQQDVEIGAQSAAEAERQLPLINDADVNAYVNRIGQKLAATPADRSFSIASAW